MLGRVRTRAKCGHGLSVSSLPSPAGFCAISKVLPLEATVETEVTTLGVKGKPNGMNAEYDDNLTVHCVAAEPHATFLRVAILDRGQEVAYTTIVLGRLLDGYRVLQMRSMLGTRIELCRLFVKIALDGGHQNRWSSPRQVRADPSRYLCDVSSRSLHVRRLFVLSRVAQLRLTSSRHVGQVQELKLEITRLKSQASLRLDDRSDFDTPMTNDPAERNDSSVL